MELKYDPISSAMSRLDLLSLLLVEGPSSHRQHIILAHQTIEELNKSRVMEDPALLDDRVRILRVVNSIKAPRDTLENTLALRSWCETEWRRILQHDADNVAANRGMKWLFVARFDILMMFQF